MQGERLETGEGVVQAQQGSWTGVQDALGPEDSLEESIATYSSILAWTIPMDRGTWRATVHRVTKSGTRLKQLSTYT